MYHSRHLLKQLTQQKNGVRQVTLAAQRLSLVPTPTQGFFILTQKGHSSTDNSLLVRQMRHFSLPSH